MDEFEASEAENAKQVADEFHQLQESHDAERSRHTETRRLLQEAHAERDRLQAEFQTFRANTSSEQRLREDEQRKTLDVADRSKADLATEKTLRADAERQLLDAEKSAAAVQTSLETSNSELDRVRRRLTASEEQVRKQRAEQEKLQESFNAMRALTEDQARDRDRGSIAQGVEMNVIQRELSDVKQQLRDREEQLVSAGEAQADIVELKRKLRDAEFYQKQFQQLELEYEQVKLVADEHRRENERLQTQLQHEGQHKKDLADKNAQLESIIKDSRWSDALAELQGGDDRLRRSSLRNSVSDSAPLESGLLNEVDRTSSRPSIGHYHSYPTRTINFSGSDLNLGDLPPIEERRTAEMGGPLSRGATLQIGSAELDSFSGRQFMGMAEPLLRTTSPEFGHKGSIQADLTDSLDSVNFLNPAAGTRGSFPMIEVDLERIGEVTSPGSTTVDMMELGKMYEPLSE